MKLCPSCGAELDEGETKCPICDFAFEKPAEKAAPPAPSEMDVTKKLDEMKARIQQLAQATAKEEQHSIGSESPGKPPLAVEEAPPQIKAIPEEEPSPPAQPSQIPEPVEEVIEETEEVEYEEVVVEEARPIGRGPSGALGTPRAEGARLPTPERVAYKISAVETKKKGVGAKHAAAAVIVVIVVILASWFILVNRQSPAIPSVDGMFDEWLGVVKYKSFYASSDSELDFTECAVQYYDGSVYWYFQTKGDLFKTSDQVTTYALFTDADGDPGTGYSLMPGFGADYAAEIAGTGGQKIQSRTMIRQFAGEDSLNFSSWTVIGQLVVGSIVRQAETSFMPSSFSTINARFIAASFDGVAIPSATLPFSLAPGILLIEQSSLVPSSCVVPSAAGTQILNLTVRAFGADLPIEEIHPSYTGVAQSADFGPLTWADESEMASGRSLTITINTTAVAPGTLIGVRMDPAGFVTDYASVVVIGRPALGYVGTFPSGMRVDGCFADWTALIDDPSDTVPIANDRINISRVGHESSTSEAFFYVDVTGGMLQGQNIPVERKQISPLDGTGGTGGVSARVTGEDMLQIYIDIDPLALSGAPSPINGSTIRPDYVIEVKGKNGVIDSKRVNRWSSGEWIGLSSGYVTVANDAQRIELELAKSSIGSSLNNSDILMMMTDWSGKNDNYSESDVVIDPFRVNISGKVWGSLDGTAWASKTDVLPGASSLVDLTSDAGCALYVAFSNGTVYKSTDLAVSWSRLIAGTLTNVIGVTTDRTAQLYAMLSDGSTYLSSTSGGPWVYRGKSPGTGYTDIDWAAGTASATTVIYATKSAANSNVHMSSDGGASWIPQVGKPPTDTTVSAVAAVRTGLNDAVYILETDGDLRVSNDSGNSWTSTHVSAGGGADFTASPCVDLDSDVNGDVWIVRSKGEVYKLTVTPWGWQTLYPTQDANEIQAFSTTPIPEFSDGALVGAVVIVIPLVLFARRRKARE